MVFLCQSAPSVPPTHPTPASPSCAGEGAERGGGEASRGGVGGFAPGGDAAAEPPTPRARGRHYAAPMTAKNRAPYFSNLA